MKVKIHQAFLVVKSRETRLTKDKARQFPIRHYGYLGYLPEGERSREDRMLSGQPYPKAICKVRAQALDRNLDGWMLLVPDREAGLVWVRPTRVAHYHQGKVRTEGGCWDILSEIPTVIL